jgi:hypothetical protein
MLKGTVGGKFLANDFHLLGIGIRRHGQPEMQRIAGRQGGDAAGVRELKRALRWIGGPGRGNQGKRQTEND